MKHGSVGMKLWYSCDKNGKKYYQGEFVGAFPSLSAGIRIKHAAVSFLLGLATPFFLAAQP